MYALTQPHTARWNEGFDLNFNQTVKARSFIEGIIGYALEASRVTESYADRTYVWNADMTKMRVITQPRSDVEERHFHDFWRKLDQYMQRGTPVRTSEKFTRMIELPANQKGRVEVVRGDDTNPVEAAAEAYNDANAALQRYQRDLVQGRQTSLLQLVRLVDTARKTYEALQEAQAKHPDIIVF